MNKTNKRKFDFLDQNNNHINNVNKLNSQSQSQSQSQTNNSNKKAKSSSSSLTPLSNSSYHSQLKSNSQSIKNRANDHKNGKNKIINPFEPQDPYGYQSKFLKFNRPKKSKSEPTAQNGKCSNHSNTNNNSNNNNNNLESRLSSKQVCLSFSESVKSVKYDNSKKAEEEKYQELNRLTLKEIQDDNLTIIKKRQENNGGNITFKYLPQTTEDLIFHSDQLRRNIQTWILSREIDRYCCNKKEDNRQVLCLQGPRASGKTTIARILLEEKGYDVTIFDGNNDIQKGVNIMKRIKETATSVCSIRGKRKPAIIMRNIQNWENFSWLEFGKLINLHDPDIRTFNRRKFKDMKDRKKEKDLKLIPDENMSATIRKKQNRNQYFQQKQKHNLNDRINRKLGLDQNKKKKNDHDDSNDNHKSNLDTDSNSSDSESNSNSSSDSSSDSDSDSDSDFQSQEKDDQKNDDEHDSDSESDHDDQSEAKTTKKKKGKRPSKKTLNQMIMSSIFNPIIFTYVPPHQNHDNHYNNSNSRSQNDDNEEESQFTKYKKVNPKLKDCLQKCKTLYMKSIPSLKIIQWIKNIIRTENLTKVIDLELVDRINIHASGINNFLYLIEDFAKRSLISDCQKLDNTQTQLIANNKILTNDFLKVMQTYSNFNIFDFVIPFIERIRNFRFENYDIGDIKENQKEGVADQGQDLQSESIISTRIKNSLLDAFDAASNYPNLKQFIHSNYLQGYQNSFSFQTISEFADCISESDYKWKNTSHSNKIGIAHIANQRNATRWNIKNYFNRQKQIANQNTNQNQNQNQNQNWTNNKIDQKENKKNKKKNDDNFATANSSRNNLGVNMPIQLKYNLKKPSIGTLTTAKQKIKTNDLMENLPSSWLFGHNIQKQKQTIETLAIFLEKKEESMTSIRYRLKPSVVNQISKFTK